MGFSRSAFIRLAVTAACALSAEPAMADMTDLAMSTARPLTPPVSSPSAAVLMDQAYAHLGRRDSQAARLAFAAAGDAGAPPQRVALELGYLALAEKDLDQARRHFSAASHGPDLTLAQRGSAEAGQLPRHLWADLYSEAFGWSRSRSPSDDLVSMARARAFVRPSLSLDAQFYAFAQATRDVASRGRGASGLPEIYADNFALLGAGALMRFWQGRIGVFAQIGPAIDLLEESKNRVTVDARAGGMLGLQSSRCGGGLGAGRPSTHLRLVPCAEGYLEITYVSRFDHNAVALGRSRAGATYLATGPVAWQLLGEVRVATDKNHDYYNNFADAGAVHRWRLGARVPLDLIVGAHAGRYFGVSGRDPAPDRLGYVDVRVVGSTYVAF